MPVPAARRQVALNFNGGIAVEVDGERGPALAVGQVNSPLKRNSPTPSALRRGAWMWGHLRPMRGRRIHL